MAIKRSGFGIAAAVLAVGGLLRVAGPGASTSSPHPQEGTKTTLSPTRGKSRSFVEEMFGKVADFCGTPRQEAQLEALRSGASVPEDHNCPSQFVIALLPDPVHTHLALLFDRHVEALQQAAARMGYVFDRAILPWDPSHHPESDDIEKRQKALQEQKDREAYPGLLIFREGANHHKQRQEAQCKASGNLRCDPPPRLESLPLFVLVVGETPTGGLRKTQFQNAVRIMNAIHKPSKDPLLILGPSFSGSFDSLQAELLAVAKTSAFPKTFVYSGTVTDFESIERFSRLGGSRRYFAAFQENDAHARSQFIEFACTRGYPPREIAILSEDQTVYGSQRTAHQALGAGAENPESETDQPSGKDPQSPVTHEQKPCVAQGEAGGVLQLHFPPEIAYFRSAYQREVASLPPDAKVPGASTLHLDLGEAGNDDDSVPPYATAQTPLSQEAVMLGILGELQKHHIKFTLLYATNPVDQLFLARYIRAGYPQGRVVVTTPDLLLARDEDSLLRGVLGLNTYALSPGLNDKLQQMGDTGGTHEERFFVSSSSAGVYNAMIGILSVEFVEDAADLPADSLPRGPYAQYGIPLSTSDRQADKKLPADADPRPSRPLLWLSVLGRDGFWPLVGLTGDGEQVLDRQEPVAPAQDGEGGKTTLSFASGDLPPDSSDTSLLVTPGAWRMAYCLIVFLLVLHTILSWTGSILSESEAAAHFATAHDWRNNALVALGALALAAAFVMVMFSRTPLMRWRGGHEWTVVLWLPLALFLILTVWDLWLLRSSPSVAATFTVLTFVFIGLQAQLAINQTDRFRTYWSTRVIHFASGVSPVLPLLLLVAAGYWWVWLSLRGLSLVDLRRPRLPAKKFLPPDAFRINEDEAEELSDITQPFHSVGRVAVPVAVLFAFALALLDLKHPLQSVEGRIYDWGYTALLALMLATFLSCLLRLLFAWRKFQQILTGLDRLPLRDAFSRMKRISWQSMWTPGGGTMRETYRVMSRGFENLTRLKDQLQNWGAPVSDAARSRALGQITAICDARDDAMRVYGEIMGKSKPRKFVPPKSDFDFTALMAVLAKIPAGSTTWLSSLWGSYSNKRATTARIGVLMRRMKTLQEEMAKMGGVLIAEVLRPWWNAERTPVVSVDSRFEAAPMPPDRALSEEYAALVYVNFLMNVLLRMRMLVICAAGMYVFIVLSMNTYPFEPHPALQTLAILLLVVMGVVVGYVYAQMHRDSILSRLTSTKAGELGWDFWLKLVSAGAIPVFSLLAVQFPEINQLLFSWLEPALQAVK